MVTNKIKNKLIKYFFQIPRIFKYKFLSDIAKIKGKPIYHQPVLFIGKGTISIGKNVNLGSYPSPGYYNSYIHIESRNISSVIEIDDDVWINNNACIICDKTKIKIGARTLIGNNFTLFDSDFHNLNPEKRLDGTQKTAQVSIGCNCFIGANVTILKGVNIGDNSVIAAGSVVVSSIPSNVIAGGNPCRVIKSLTNG